MLKDATKLFGLAAIAVSISVGGANAQSKWTGISIGAGLGAGSINHDLKLGPGPALPPGVFGLELDSIGGEGFLGTVGVAADYQINRFVIGAFLDYDFSKIDSKVSLSIPPLGGFNAEGKIKLEDQFTIGGRIGYLATPDTLWYSLIGYTRAGISDFDIGVSGPINTTLKVGVPSFNGYVLGGGVETMLAPNWSVKAEYRYSHLSSESLDMPLGVNSILSASLEPTIHTVRTTLNYKFNWDGSEPAAAPLK